jgi:hypothetical protein
MSVRLLGLDAQNGERYKARFLMRRLGDKASRGSGHLGRLTNSRFILFPFPSLLFHAFSRDMALPCLALHVA